ncbi:ParB-like protein [Necator americanus]|uniref:ParB-like protein n=1 Tax=Necator americanus TaxID=51031 RepID=W2TX83_NECAM|nr:ParB-like protein [Necator americanus]ETN86443.1 ParB-like protein [Necator americanus]
MHLGAAFHEKGKRVLVVDADGQNTLVHWASASADGDTGIPFPVVNLSEAGGQIHREIKKFVNDYDVIVVDCPPSITEKVSGVVLLAATVAVIPTSSSPADYWSSVGLVKLIQQAQVMNEDLRAVFLLNKTEEKRMLTRELKRALEELGFPLLRTQIPTREAYKQAMALGQTVLQMNDRGARLAAVEARPDTTSSEKRTALDRLNAIDGLVQDKPKTREVAGRSSQPALVTGLEPAVERILDDAPGLENESVEYRAWRIAQGYRPGQIIELPLKDIKPSPFNPRHFYLKASIAELAVNLAKQGQQQAIHVIPDYAAPGSYYVSDGGRRVRALKEANKEVVKAIVVDLPIGIQSYKLGYDLNVQRDSQTVFDNAVEMVARPDRFGSNMAYQVGRYHGARGTEATLRLINRIVADDLSTRQVADIVKGRASAQESPKPAGRQRYAQRLEIKLDGVAVGDLKSYGDDRLELRLKGLTKDRRDAILQQIEQILKTK